ncbi:sensor histidine kinase [Phenylobacterium immobile]|uniref:sensor histidine kinase n=1 Tax=Phenylobacterium immobile TaxID=21 RepID=UPI000B163403|nr:sensor histidine kinase [Phenylobacterium immobile]
MSDKTSDTLPTVGSYGFRPPVGSDALLDRVNAMTKTAAQSTILVGELHHRLQNTLAIVLALSRLTARTVNTVEEFQVAFGQRIAAMARTNALLLQGQVQAVSVQTALEAELQPFLDDNGQVTLLGDDLYVSPDAALSLSLIFHELATNAAKYGALAKPTGRLVVECHGDSNLGAIHWRESVAAPLKEASRSGSGSLLISRLARSLGGAAQIDLRPGGLEATITFNFGEPEPELIAE